MVERLVSKTKHLAPTASIMMKEYLNSIVNGEFWSAAKYTTDCLRIVSGPLIAFPPSVVLRLLPLHLAATKVVIPRATRGRARFFDIDHVLVQWH